MIDEQERENRIRIKAAEGNVEAILTRVTRIERLCTKIEVDMRRDRGKHKEEVNKLTDDLKRALSILAELERHFLEEPK